MKIVVYSPTFYPVKDGTSIQAKRLADLLSGGHDVKPLTFAVDRNIRFAPELLHRNDGTARFIPRCAPNKSSLKFPELDGSELIGTLKAFHPHVIHIRGWYQLNVVDQIIDAAVNIGSRIFWHTDGIDECHSHFKVHDDYAALVSRAESMGVTFLVQTNNDVNLLSSLGVNKRACYLIPPIMGGDFGKKKCKTTYDSPRLLTLARFFDYKKHEEIAHLVRSVDPTLELIIAGATDDTGSKKIIQKLNQLGISLVLDPSNDFVLTLYNYATHFLSASRRETLGISTLEAVYNGCVPLVRRNKGIVSYLSDDFLFEDDEEFKSKFERLTQLRVSEEIMQQLNQVKRRLSPLKILSRMEGLYRG